MAAIHLHMGTFYTDDDMFDSGYAACCECGAPHERTEKIKNCNRCSKPLIFIRSKFIPVFFDEAKYRNAQKLLQQIHNLSSENFLLKRKLLRYKKANLESETATTIYPNENGDQL